MAHSLASDATVRHLDAAAVAYHALVLHAAVFTACALPVLLRTENSFAEQAVLFRAVRSVVDRLGLLDFAKRPAADVVGTCQADANRGVIVDAVVTGALADAHVKLLGKLMVRAISCELLAVSQ